MIFVTVGALFGFDRLIRLVDELAPRFPDQEFMAQIGNGDYVPKNMKYARSLSAAEYRETVGRSRLLVAHAGMGSIISALENRCGVVLLPRRANLGEHTTDHQEQTARWVEGKPGVFVAWEDADLFPAIEKALLAERLEDSLPTTAPAAFLQRITAYIESL